MELAHDSVHRFVKAWRADRARTPAQAFIPLWFGRVKPISSTGATSAGHRRVTSMAKVAAHAALSYSRMPIVRAYPRERQEMVFDAHDKAFPS